MISYCFAKTVLWNCLDTHSSLCLSSNDRIEAKLHSNRRKSCHQMNSFSLKHFSEQISYPKTYLMIATDFHLFCPLICSLDFKI